MPSPVKSLVNSELTKQSYGQRIRLIALPRFGQNRTFDLAGTQSHISNKGIGICRTNDIDTGSSTQMIVPGMTPEPAIQRISSTIKLAAIIIFPQRARRIYARHVGFLCANFCSFAFFAAGRKTQASNASHCCAGMVTILRPRRLTSAASTEARRTKSLRFVRASSLAASNTALSAGLTRTLRMEVVEED